MCEEPDVTSGLVSTWRVAELGRGVVIPHLVENAARGTYSVANPDHFYADLNHIVSGPDWFVVSPD